MTKSYLGEERVYFSFSVGAGSQSRNLEAGNEAEVVGKCCLLTWSLWRSACFFIPPKTICPGVVPCTLFGPFHIPYESRKCSTGLPSGYHVEAVFPTEVPLPFWLELTSTWQKIKQDCQPGPKLYPLESDEVRHPTNVLMSSWNRSLYS